ncbi:MAG: hypothetical protein KatS3mg057_3112 [Herpetosiphonaceae bacterium]|nr:MAG: hypothetical protein KatS3mg057_3112 [Herpetosiphonaceae bacterium]
MHEDVPTGCGDPHCEEIAALTGAAALGSELEPNECARLVAYLAGCERCRYRLKEYAAIAQLLPLCVPEIEPPASLRERIVAAAQGGQQSRPRRRRTFAWRRLLVPALGLLAALMLVWNLMLQWEIRQQQVRAAHNRALLLSLFGDTDARERRLEATDVAPEATGRLWLAPDAGALGLYVDKLPPLPPDQVYQIWLIRDGKRVSGGTFSVDQRGRAWLIVQPEEPLDSFDAVGITAEPEPGSPGPTGPKYLGNTL